MTVYLDPLVATEGGRRCHLFADHVEALHTFARRLGLRRSHFRTEPFPHYALFSRMYRRTAIAMGARQLSRDEALAIVQTLRPPDGAEVARG